MAEPRRISQTLIKPLPSSHVQPLPQGLRAAFPGWDAPQPAPLPPRPPSAQVERTSAPASSPEGPVLASVRIDMNGEIVAVQGAAEWLAPLVGYVTRMGALLALQLGMPAFEALSAELGSRRALIFVEGDEMVGLMLGPGALYQELRQQLGV